MRTVDIGMLSEALQSTQQAGTVKNYKHTEEPCKTLSSYCLPSLFVSEYDYICYMHSSCILACSVNCFSHLSCGSPQLLQIYFLNALLNNSFFHSKLTDFWWMASFRYSHCYTILFSCQMQGAQSLRQFCFTSAV